MSKLKVVIVSEKTVAQNMGGCGRNMPTLCGAKLCFPNASRKD